MLVIQKIKQKYFPAKVFALPRGQVLIVLHALVVTLYSRSLTSSFEMTMGEKVFTNFLIFIKRIGFYSAQLCSVINNQKHKSCL